MALTERQRLRLKRIQLEASKEAIQKRPAKEREDDADQVIEAIEKSIQFIQGKLDRKIPIETPVPDYFTE
jgi:hypothetical protein